VRSFETSVRKRLEISAWLGRDRERGILIVVRDPGTASQGNFGENVYSNHGCGSNLNFLDPTVMET